MRLKILQCIFLHELTEMFVEVTVVVIAIDLIGEIMGRINEVRHCFANAHYLQCFFTSDTGAGFEVALQCADGNFILRSEFFERDGEIIMLKTMIEYIAYDGY